MVKTVTIPLIGRTGRTRVGIGDRAALQVGSLGSSVMPPPFGPSRFDFRSGRAVGRAEASPDGAEVAALDRATRLPVAEPESPGDGGEQQHDRHADHCRPGGPVASVDEHEDDGHRQDQEAHHGRDPARGAEGPNSTTPPANVDPGRVVAHGQEPSRDHVAHDGPDHHHDRPEHPSQDDEIQRCAPLRIRLPVDGPARPVFTVLSDRAV